MFEDENKKIYNILISKGENDENKEYQEFISKLYSRDDFLWKETMIGSTDYSSIPKTFFKDVDVIILLSGLYKENKESLDSLVKIANEENIPLVMVRPLGLEEVPLELEEYSDGLVGWNANCIIDTIKGTDVC